MALPTFFGADAIRAGTGALTNVIAFPASTQADDVALLVVQSEAEAVTLSDAQGFVEVPSSPQNIGAGAGANRLTVFWKRLVGGDTPPDIADPGDHLTAMMFVFRGCETTGNPWDIMAGDTDATQSTAWTIPGGTTTVDDCLVFVIACTTRNATATTEFSGWTNPDLANIQERNDNTQTAGNGGGFGTATGEKATAGALADTTATSTIDNLNHAMMMIALKPPAGATPVDLLLGKVATGEVVRGVTLAQDGADALLLGKVATGEAVRGIDLSGATPVEMLLGKIATGQAVRGVTLAQAGPDALLLGRITTDELVRGITLTAAGPASLLLGHVETDEALRGINFTQDGPDTLLLGKIVTDEAVYGVTLGAAVLEIQLGKVSSEEVVRGINLSAAGPSTLSLGKIASGELLRGLSLAQSGPLALALGKIATNEVMRGLGLSKSGAVVLSLGKVASSAIVRGLDISLPVEVIIYDIRPMSYESGVEVAHFGSARRPVFFHSGIATVQLGSHVRGVEYDSGVESVSY